MRAHASWEAQPGAQEVTMATDTRPSAVSRSNTGIVQALERDVKENLLF